MIKLILECVSLAVVVLAIIGFFGVGSFKKQFIGVAAIAVFAGVAAREVMPGHELATLTGVVLLLIADFIWWAVTYGKAHNVSVFGWLQSHKADADKAADLASAEQAAVNALKVDGGVAKVAVVATASGAVASAASTAAGVVVASIAKDVTK